MTFLIPVPKIVQATHSCPEESVHAHTLSANDNEFAHVSPKASNVRMVSSPNVSVIPDLSINSVQVNLHSSKEGVMSRTLPT